MKNDPPIPDELTKERMNHGTDNAVRFFFNMYKKLLYIIISKTVTP